MNTNRLFISSSLFLLTFAGKAWAQPVSGTWTGNSKKSFWVSNAQEIVVELTLYNDSLLTGVSHLYYNRNKYEHHKLSGKYNPHDSTAIFTEDSVISYRFGFGMSMCEGVYEMKLSREGSRWRLLGKWRDKKKGLLRCPTLETWLYKDAGESIATDSMAAPWPIKDPVTSRAEDIQKVVELEPGEADSIRLDIYDNGIVDNDTVSVYFNDTKIVSSQMVSTAAISLSLVPEKGKTFQKIKLVAENLGSIPPNTALLIITTRKNEYRLQVSSDYEKNGVIELLLKE